MVCEHCRSLLLQYLADQELSAQPTPLPPLPPIIAPLKRRRPKRRERHYYARETPREGAHFVSFLSQSARDAWVREMPGRTIVTTEDLELRARLAAEHEPAKVPEPTIDLGQRLAV